MSQEAKMGLTVLRVLGVVAVAIVLMLIIGMAVL
jgi:hypothetical protein